MSGLGFVQSPTGYVNTASATASPVSQVTLPDMLASARGLWLRGRITGWPSSPNAGARPSAWWSGQRDSLSPTAPRATVRIHVHVAGQVLRAEVAVGSRGEFDATFDVALPPTARGWRVARTELWLRETASTSTERLLADKRGLVLSPRADADGVVVVALPSDASFTEQAGHDLQRRLAADGDKGTPGRRSSLLYLAPVCEDGGKLTAMTARGWPAGHVVPLDGASAAAALDRLRWLFADVLPMRVVDLTDNHIASSPAGPIRVAPCPTHHRPARSGLATRYPLVFCHGMLACSVMRMRLAREYNYWSVLRKYLNDRGFRVLYPHVTPTGGVEQRAAQLKEQIQRWTDEPVNLIAHSMGGLDARQMITHLGMAGQVRSLTTLSTPHRGSCLADWFLDNFRQRLPLLRAMEALGVNVDGFRDCRPSACRAFSDRTPDMPHVQYFSYGGDVPLLKVSPMLRRAWDRLTADEGPNDGLVSVQSARWGEYLGTLYADHFAQTPDGLFVHPNEDFDSLGFITRVVQDLARRGH